MEEEKFYLQGSNLITSYANTLMEKQTEDHNKMLTVEYSEYAESIVITVPDKDV